MNGSTGDIADDFYHRFKEDIQLMKTIGLDSFRFSISWTRIFPNGKLTGGVNQLGVKFYNDLINELLSNGIKPFVTLLHFDPPQALEDEYGGPLSPRFVNDFVAYADFCFETFGDRVKKWVTINEPNMYAMRAYDFGSFAPGRCSQWMGTTTGCAVPRGDSSTEPYVAGHHFLLSHAKIVKLYRKKYKEKQKGEIGITTTTHWFEPKYRALPSSQLAARRVLDFMFGWFAHPIAHGEYPESMRSLVGDRLPRFTEEQADLVKGSIDFLGVNYYTMYYAEDAPSTARIFAATNPSYSTDSRAIQSTEKDGVPIGTPTAVDWLFICPKGFKKLLLHIKNKYNNLPVYITENGMTDQSSLSLEMALNDTLRIKYHNEHLLFVECGCRGGANVKGYYMWCFFDDFEWNGGYTVRFGMTYVDFNDNLKRYLKASAYWFKNFLAPPPSTLQSEM
ncbi:unnamed protein product [Linum tenue]|uniref:Uncharacterized protein n=2 Tax=Linum tenue TaxID=586396 RepID=A0AAV0IPZ3_9ROSI|nr:unnamed protein product [Linum tenue]